MAILIEIHCETDARQSSPLSFFVFKFLVKIFIAIDVLYCENSNIEICSADSIFDLDYGDDIMLLSEDPCNLQVLHNVLKVDRSRVRMHLKS